MGQKAHQVSPIFALVGAPPEPIRVLGQPLLRGRLFQPRNLCTRHRIGWKQPQVIATSIKNVTMQQHQFVSSKMIARRTRAASISLHEVYICNLSKHAHDSVQPNSRHHICCPGKSFQETRADQACNNCSVLQNLGDIQMIRLRVGAINIVRASSD